MTCHRASPRVPVIFELAFSSVRVLCAPIFSAESPATMLVLWPRDKAGTYLAVIAFPGAIFFAFLNLALPANSLSSARRLGFASMNSNSVRLSLVDPDCWPLSEACGGGTITATGGAPASVESCRVCVMMDADSDSDNNTSPEQECDVEVDINLEEEDEHEGDLELESNVESDSEESDSDDSGNDSDGYASF